MIFQNQIKNSQQMKLTEKLLKKIIEYLKHYQTDKPKDISKPLPGPDLKPPILDQWDYDYISKVSLQDCVDLINGANFLDVSWTG